MAPFFDFRGCSCCLKQILKGMPMKNNDRTIYVTEEIRKIPVMYLLDMEMAAINRLEKQIREEIRRTNLALEWIQGIKSIKSASQKGGRNG